MPCIVKPRLSNTSLPKQRLPAVVVGSRVDRPPVRLRENPRTFFPQVGRLFPLNGLGVTVSSHEVYDRLRQTDTAATGAGLGVDDD